LPFSYIKDVDRELVSKPPAVALNALVLKIIVAIARNLIFVLPELLLTLSFKSVF